MRWTQDSENALQVIAKILARQLGLPEDIIIVTDIVWWRALHPEDKTNTETFSGICSRETRHIFINVEHCSNFYDVVACAAHELWHIKRPRVENEYKINRLAEKWLNNDLVSHIPDLSKV